MLENFSPDQPSIQGFVQRIGDELNAKAVALLHENGQVLCRHGWIEDKDYPAMAALVSAMIAAGKSLGNLGENFPASPRRFACDSESAGIYTVAVTPEIWLAVLYDQPLNPGRFRMRVRNYAEILARLGVQQPEQWEMPKKSPPTGANLPPVSSREGVSQALLTPGKSTLFGDISDEEIDELFENARS